MDLPFNYITPASNSSVSAGGLEVRGEQRHCRELVKSLAAAMSKGNHPSCFPSLPRGLAGVHIASGLQIKSFGALLLSEDSALVNFWS